MGVHIARWSCLGLLLGFLLSPVGASFATHEGCDHFYAETQHYVIGTNGDDHCHGISDGDIMSGNDGSDDLAGRGYNDGIRGNDGHDLLNGDEGADTIGGDAGYDRIRGGDGHDNQLEDMYWGNDADKVCDNAGFDRVYLQDGDGMDIWYKEPNDGYDDYNELNQFDAINNGGCQIPGS